VITAHVNDIAVAAYTWPHQTFHCYATLRLSINVIHNIYWTSATAYSCII